jgi:hypothetical protein
MQTFNQKEYIQQWSLENREYLKAYKGQWYLENEDRYML